MTTRTTHRRPRRLPTLAAIAGATLLAGASLAQAQAPDSPTRPTLRPPQPRNAENVPILSYAAVLVVIIAPLAVNFISSKRGHQD